MGDLHDMTLVLDCTLVDAALQELRERPIWRRCVPAAHSRSDAVQ
jgi:hypothetical protein